jgi:hypothetical protein
MGGINWGRVILGGLLAGILINVFEFILNGIILAKDWEAALLTRGIQPIAGAKIAVRQSVHATAPEHRLRASINSEIRICNRSVASAINLGPWIRASRFSGTTGVNGWSLPEQNRGSTAKCR